jgi:hypothetical protein
MTLSTLRIQISPQHSRSDQCRFPSNRHSPASRKSSKTTTLSSSTELLKMSSSLTRRRRPNPIRCGSAKNESDAAAFRSETSPIAATSYAWTRYAAAPSSRTCAVTAITKIAYIVAFTLPAESAVSRRRCVNACWSAASTCRCACCSTASRTQGAAKRFVDASKTVTLVKFAKFATLIASERWSATSYAASAVSYDDHCIMIMNQVF